MAASLAVRTATARPGLDVFFGAPTYRQTGEAFMQAKRMDPGGALEFSEGKLETRIPNGSRIQWRSLDDPDSCRHINPDIVITDETRDVAREAWNEVLRPALMNSRGGAWHFSTPKGHNWLWERCEEAKTREDSAFFHAPTLGCQIIGTDLQRVPHEFENPEIAWDEVVSMWRDLPSEVFRQEVMAEFVAMAGRVFGTYRRDLHVQPVTLERNLPVWIGIDFGYRTFAMVACQADKHDGLRQFDEGEWHDLTTDQAIERIRRFPWAERIELIACDPAGEARVSGRGAYTDVNALRQAFPSARVVYSTRPEHRTPEWRASQIRNRLFSADGRVRYIIDPKCEATIRMLEMSVYPVHKAGMPEKAEPVKDGKLDHIRDALGYLEVNAFHVQRSVFLKEQPF
jgi:hypothetical protein